MYNALNNLIKTIYADGSIVESKPTKWGMPGTVVQCEETDAYELSTAYVDHGHERTMEWDELDCLKTVTADVHLRVLTYCCRWNTFQGAGFEILLEVLRLKQIQSGKVILTLL